MKRNTMALVLAGGLTLATSTSAQGPTGPVIQVGVDLVRVDAVITDAKGQPVSDLRPEDFTLTVDGKKVPIANSAFFRGNPAQASAMDSVATPGAGIANDRERSLIFLIDDLNISFGSMYRAKRALRAFAGGWDSREAMIGVRLTSDRTDTIKLSRKPEKLAASLEGVRFNIMSDMGMSSGPAYNTASMGGFASTVVDRGWRSTPDISPVGSNPAIVRANFQQRIFSLVTTINALRSIPGRKAVVFVSEGLTVGRDRTSLGIDSPFDRLFDDSSIDSSLRMITEVANRASVVVYTIDPGGLVSDAPGADVAYAPSMEQRSFAALSRMDVQQTLLRLAEDTGGLSVFNRNDLKRGLHDVVEDQRSYYLIGFEPPLSAFDKSSGKPKFHKIKLTTNRKDLRVRTRAGFYGVTDEEVLQRAPLMKAPTP